MASVGEVYEDPVVEPIAKFPLASIEALFGTISNVLPSTVLLVPKSLSQTTVGVGAVAHAFVAPHIARSSAARRTGGATSRSSISIVLFMVFSFLFFSLFGVMS